MSTTMPNEDLRELFLFAELDDAQLDWIREHGDLVEFGADEVICRVGDPARCFWVLVAGEFVMQLPVRGDLVETARASRPGSYGGTTHKYDTHVEADGYKHTLRTVTASSFLALPAAEWAAVLQEWFPLAMHLVQGVVVGGRRASEITGERERLLALGSLSAGLTHELNNPAAAASRATGALRDRVAGMRHKLAMLACGKLDGAVIAQLVELQEEAVRRVATAPELSAMATSDAEDALGDELADRGVGGAWDLAPTLVAGGLDVEWLEKVERTVAPGASGATGEGQASLEAAVRWIAYAVETETLMGEITDATTRIGTLVGAARQYSQLDRAPFGHEDLRGLLKSTLVMMNRKLEGITLVKELDPDLPPVPCYPAELNQVWTNLVDNAVGAMAGLGEHAERTLTIRTRRDGANAVVEIGDTGPGIPDDVRPRIFEPFFTTKDVGEGTGLGLDISYRIVVNKHHGDIRVHTGPGGTVFEVCLPLA